jgi:hypothetical protein
METWELAARESCRDTLAQYNHSGDRYLLEELAAAFCDDGVLEVRGSVTLTGRYAIVEWLSGGRGTTNEEIRRVAKEEQAAGPVRLVRHHLTNVRFESVTPAEVRVASYFMVLTDIGLDHCGRYRDRMVPVGERWLIAQRRVSVDWHAPESRFGGSPL